MEGSTIKNPFIDCTARDMKYAEVYKYWCSPFELYNLNENELFTSKTPIVIEGIRGSGKTMLLKYLSYNVQVTVLGSVNVDDRIRFFQDRSFGIYFRNKIDDCNMFSDFNIPEEIKNRMFKTVFVLSIAREILDNISDFYNHKVPNDLTKVVVRVLGVESESFDDAIECLQSYIAQISNAINDNYKNSKWFEDIIPLFSKGNLIRELITEISENIKEWNNIQFVVLLDEYENLGMFKPIVNTFIKQIDDSCNLSYRIGTRPAGIEIDNSTYVGKERIQVDRDYLLRRLVYRKQSEYVKFALSVSERRLNQCDEYKNRGLTDIKKILGVKEDFDKEANEVAKGLKQFDLLKEYFLPKEMKKVIKEISCDNKLIEMYNILLVTRNTDYKKVGEISRRFIESKTSQKDNKEDKELYKYYLDYNCKYRLTLLFILLTIYKTKKKYYSFNTFIYLSSGSINDFISLCRNTFRYINPILLDDLCNGKTIDPILQNYGAIETADAQMVKLGQSNEDPEEMYNFVDNLGTVFQEYHRDYKARYPETNQFAFTDENSIRKDEKLKKYLMELINYGAIIRKENRQRPSLTEKRRGEVYQLNRIFAPRYQYSYRTRGGFNQMITPELFNRMLHSFVGVKEFNDNLELHSNNMPLYDYLREDEEFDGDDDI